MEKRNEIKVILRASYHGAFACMSHREKELPAALIDRGAGVNPNPLLGFPPSACVRVASL